MGARRNSIAFAAAALALAGCGKGALISHQGLPANVQLVSTTDIARYPAGSPQAALLTWWRDVQFDDVVGYLTFLKPAVATAQLKAGQAVPFATLLSGHLQSARPQITGTNISGANAVLYTQITYRQPIGNTGYATNTAVQAFSLVNLQGGWKLADDYFIRHSISAGG